MRAKKASMASWLALCVMFMTGCIPSPPAAWTTPSLQTVVPTATLMAATETQSPATPTPESFREFNVVAACVPIEPQVPQDFNLKGGLFLYDPSREPSRNVVLMDLSKRSVSEFVNVEENVNRFSISPTGAWVAYFAVNKQNYSDKKLLVKNFATNSTLEIPWNPEWELGGVKGWLNDQKLLITLQSYTYPYPLIAFNPFTRDSEALPSTFPNQKVLPPGTGVSPAEYDPSLNYVVYSAQEADVNGFALFDHAANAQVAFFPSEILVESGSPAWSHDGQKFVFVSKMIGSGSFINFGRPDGNVTRIADFSRLVGMGPFTMQSLTWSPDDKFVAVILYNVDKNNMLQLMLLDLDRQKVMDPCIEVNYNNWSSGPISSSFPVWSPDSRYLIVEDQSGDRKNKVILIDVAQMRAEKLAQDQKVFGWVTLNP